MEVMRGTVVSCTKLESLTSTCCWLTWLEMLYVQLPVEVEHSGAETDNASDLLTVVMGLENVLMAVMRLDVVSS